MRPQAILSVARRLGLLLLLGGCAQFADPCAAPPDGWVRLPPAAPAGTAPPPLPQGLKIVALGSSTTEGTGASTPANSYPAQLERILAYRYPEAGVEVVNRGVAGDVVPRTLARLNRDVIALSPDLVIWQLGTNDALYRGNVASVLVDVQLGVDRIRTSGAALALLSPQALPDEPRDRAVREMNEALAGLAAANRLPFLDRHKLMRWWYGNGAPVEEVLADDLLHMNDMSYECLAARVADELPAVLAAAGAGTTAVAPGP